MTLSASLKSNVQNTTPTPRFRVVLDTTVYISASLSSKGLSSRAWEFARGRRFQLITSPFIVNEVAKVLRRLDRLEEQAIIQRLKEIVHLADIVQPTTELQVVRDVNDNPIVECAIDGKADMIVSLDNDLLTLKAYDNIPILHVADLLRTLGE